MKTWKRTEVTIETETLVLSRHGRAARARCEGCGVETVMLSPTEAASLAGVTTADIFALVTAGSVHVINLSEGVMLVCGLSLGAIIRK